MNLPAAVDSEVTFLSGVDANGVVAPIAARTWENGTIPAQYGESLATKWGDPHTETPATISYAFTAVSNWTLAEQTTFRTAMSLWSAITNVTFIEITDETGADFRIVRGNDQHANWNFGAQTGQPTGGTELLSPEYNNGYPNLSVDTNQPGYGPLTLDFEFRGGFPFSTLVHELGHGLGLGHAGPYNGVADSSTQQFTQYDTRLWSIMSYIDPWDQTAAYYASYPQSHDMWGLTPDGFSRVPQTPMMLDILAVQRLYGAATSGPLAEGGVIFGFNSNLEGNLSNIFDFSLNAHPVLTLWSGGTGNTLDLSGFTEGSKIDLHPSAFSSAAGLFNNIGIAPDTIIETAIGGSGDDIIYGTELNNVLIGNVGHDMIFGYGGNDQISGGLGADQIFFGTTGSSTLRDSLEDLNGDTITGVSSANTIEITGALFSRADMTISVGAQATTFSAGAYSFTTDGTSSTAGTFMLTPREMGGEGHSFISFVNFLPTLSEGVTVNPANINGIANAPFITGDGSVSFSVDMVSAESAFKNMLGYYTLDQNGTISGVHILFDNTMDASALGAGHALGTPGSGEQIGFFLIQDGFSAYGDLPDDLSFILGNGSQPSLYSASLGLLTHADIFYSTATFNHAGANQTLSGVTEDGAGLLIGFEDVASGIGDNDFQDVVIALKSFSGDGIFI